MAQKKKKGMPKTIGYIRFANIAIGQTLAAKQMKK